MIRTDMSLDPLDTDNDARDTRRDIVPRDRPVRPGSASGNGAADRGGTGSEFDDPHIGQVLGGRYHILEQLGGGAHGYVYAGVQLGTERKVAIKLLRPEALDDPEIEGRFRHEGLVMCNLKSAHTVTTYDFAQTDDGAMYIVMEMLEGFTLRELVQEHAPLHWRRALRLTGQMCEALAEAHASGIVHRDLKPANIFIDERPDRPEFVKILDFGIAKILEGEPFGMSTIPKLTARGQTVGTLFYMSPEQLLGTRLDGRSDIYALGVLAFELLTGHLPFPDARKPAKLIAAQLRSEPPAPSTVVSDANIPEEIDALVLHMLEKESERRPSAEDVLAQCTEILARPESAPVERARSIGGANLDTEARAALGAAPTETLDIPQLPEPQAASGTTAPGTTAQETTAQGATVDSGPAAHGAGPLSHPRQPVSAPRTASVPAGLTTEITAVRKPPILLVSIVVFVVVVTITALVI